MCVCAKDLIYVPVQKRRWGPNVFFRNAQTPPSHTIVNENEWETALKIICSEISPNIFSSLFTFFFSSLIQFNLSLNTYIFFLLPSLLVTGSRKLPWWSRVNRSNMSADAARNITIKQTVDNIRAGPHVNNNSGVWTWLSTRRPSSSPIDQIGPSSGSPVENHYTHMMDDAYSPEPTDEALYAELDRESIRSGNPSYQNTAYSQCGEHDMPIVSSAPSSAYYSDLSTTGNVACDRGYEVVGMTHLSAPMPHWENSDTGSNGRRPPRLAAINETTSVPSDYV